MNDDQDALNVALFDMDGSLADYERAMRTSLTKLMGPTEVMPDDLWDDSFTHLRDRMRLIKDHPGWWLNLPKMETGMLALRMAVQNGFAIHILTKGPKKHPVAWMEKVQWCHLHLGEDTDIHITSDKGMVYGKLLYDDHPEYMLRWLKFRPRGLGIMPVNKTNRNFRHPNVLMWDGTNVEEMGRAMKACRERTFGQPLNMIQTT